MEEALEIFPLIQARHPNVLISQLPINDGIKLVGVFDLECDFGQKYWADMLEKVVNILVNVPNVTTYSIDKGFDGLRKVFVLRVYCDGLIP